MQYLLLLALCVSCALGVNFQARRRLEALEHDLESRLIQREIARDQRSNGEEADMYEREAREVNEYRHLQRRETLQDQGCIQGDIIFVVDSSGSIGITNWDYVLKFMAEVIDKMGVGPTATHAGVVTYGNRAHIIFHLNNYTNANDMKAAIAKTPFLDENTNTSGGIYTANKIMFTAEHGDRPLAPNLMLVITDGVSTYDNDKTIPYAQEAKANNIKVVSLGVGDKISKEELEGMASIGINGKPLVYQVGSYDMLANIQETLARVACGIADPIDTKPDCDTVPDVVCVGMPCKTKCKFGFAQDKNLCQTCNCLPEPAPCP